ncbi:MAG: flagellar FlbD family protein [Planctomycetota bacterium]|jgi:flagellar protein FlbD|nr:flagellar FlbD family protein [Planctomycetota bacterium]
MIHLTHRNGKGFILNAELIKFVEEVPDTIITLRDGEKILVAETADEVVAKSLEYARRSRFLPEGGGSSPMTERKPGAAD